MDAGTWPSPTSALQKRPVPKWCSPRPDQRPFSKFIVCHGNHKCVRPPAAKKFTHKFLNSHGLAPVAAPAAKFCSVSHVLQLRHGHCMDATNFTARGKETCDRPITWILLGCRWAQKRRWPLRASGSSQGKATVLFHGPIGFQS